MARVGGGARGSRPLEQQWDDAVPRPYYLYNNDVRGQGLKDFMPSALFIYYNERAMEETRMLRVERGNVCRDMGDFGSGV